jgi:hypothetical protein
MFLMPMSSWGQFSQDGSDLVSLDEFVVLNKIKDERNKGTKLWAWGCGQLSRDGYGYGGIFASRWSDTILWGNPYVWCIKDGEPAYTSQLTAQIINGWLEGWLIAKMSRDTKTNFTTYGVVDSLIGLQPEYFSFVKKIVRLREILQGNFEIYRASIPTTIEAFEDALTQIIQETGFMPTIQAEYSQEAGVQKLIQCLSGKQAATKSDQDFVEFKTNTKGEIFYRIKNSSIIYEQKRLQYIYFTSFIPHTHYPWDSWTKLHASAVFSCSPELLTGLMNAVLSQEASLNTPQITQTGVPQ